MIDLENFVETLEQRPVAVFGLGLSGISALKALRHKNVKIYAWDDQPDQHEEARKAGADVRVLTADVLAQCACLILAPGVPLHFPEPHPVVIAAQEAGIEIISDIEVLHRCNHGRKTIGITGTNGKSTTTALINHILSVCGKSVAMGGNIGMPALSLEMPWPDGYFVLELSSYQLDLCPSFRPDIAVWLNITADHIDRHGTLENYITSKEKIFGRSGGKAVIGIDDPYSAAVYEKIIEAGGKALAISVGDEVEKGVFIKNGHIFDVPAGKPIEIGSIAGVTTLLGTHNQQNAAAAYAVCRMIGLEPEDILDAIKTYPGLPHRQYPVRTINGVVYINDSKATNVDAASKALACYRNIYWIVGGQPKEGGLNGLESYMDKIRHAFLIGEAAEEFAVWLSKYDVPHHFSRTLDVATEEAHCMAQADRGQPGGGGTVLLSPACASFDQFKNFADRGDRFTYLVEDLEEEQAA